MKKKIEDYLHLYYGTECMFGVTVPGQEMKMYKDIIGARIIHNINAKLGDCKPILRPMNDMSNDEALECSIQQAKIREVPYPELSDWAYRVDWMLKKGFDLFGLIDEGLAVNACELKTGCSRCLAL